MAQLEKIREEIGWLKVIFGILIATDISLTAWFIQNLTKSSLLLLSVCSFAILIFTMVIGWVHKQAYNKIKELEKL